MSDALLEDNKMLMETLKITKKFKIKLALSQNASECLDNEIVLSLQGCSETG